MAIECAYSFEDLYIAAHHRKPAEGELQRLYNLSQQERNKMVQRWAEQAAWEIRERIGSDGQLYVAFAPAFEQKT